jgi:hypothetical protein
MDGFALDARLADRRWQESRRLLERILEDGGLTDATRKTIRDLLR